MSFCHTMRIPAADLIRRWACALLCSMTLALTVTASAQTVEQRIEDTIRNVDQGVARGPYRAAWDSLLYYTVPNWYQDAKFGIFVHWGVYSVPAFGNEWYPRNMYLEDNPAYKHHLETYGPHSEFGYKDFIPRFTAEKFDPAHWADLFRRAGARYVVPVAEHHDGFPMYDCSFTEWNAVNMGPKRDIIAELAAAVRKVGMHFGVSSHRAENWWYYEGGRKIDSDVRDPRYAGLYGAARPRNSQPDKNHLDSWLARTAELVEKYQPELVWFDWWIEQPAFEPYVRRFAAYYYNRAIHWNHSVAINYKKEAFPEGSAVLDIERGKLDSLRSLFWQTDTSVCNRSWGYVDNHDYKSVGTVVDDLVDIVSKNGSLLLNIAPRPDGTIPEPQEKMLLEIGRWLEVNGEAIYGTRPWKVYGEGPTRVVGGSFKDTAGQPFTGEDIRFSARGNTLYATALAWPENGRITIRSLAAGAPHAGQEVTHVELLGSGETVKWSRSAEGLTVELPSEQPCEHAFVLKISLAG